jgi:hypothetical protein
MSSQSSLPDTRFGAAAAIRENCVRAWLSYASSHATKKPENSAKAPRALGRAQSTVPNRINSRSCATRPQKRRRSSDGLRDCRLAGTTRSRRWSTAAAAQSDNHAERRLRASPRTHRLGQEATLGRIAHSGRPGASALADQSLPECAKSCPLTTQGAYYLDVHARSARQLGANPRGIGRDSAHRRSAAHRRHLGRWPAGVEGCLLVWGGRGRAD